MTTKNSPHELIHAQAEKIAGYMKAHVEAKKPSLKTGVGMDDKLVSIEMDWDAIKAIPVEELVTFICAIMREDKAVLEAFRGHPQIQTCIVVSRNKEQSEVILQQEAAATGGKIIDVNKPKPAGDVSLEDALPPVDRSKLH